MQWISSQWIVTVSLQLQQVAEFPLGSGIPFQMQPELDFTKCPSRQLCAIFEFGSLEPVQFDVDFRRRSVKA